MQKTNYEQKSFAFLNQKDERYKDEEWLREQYWGNNLTQKEISDKCNCSSSTIGRWLDSFGVSTRGSHPSEKWSKESMQDYCNDHAGGYKVLSQKWIDRGYQKQKWALVSCSNEEHEPYWIWWNNFLGKEEGNRCKKCYYNKEKIIDWTKDTEKKIISFYQEYNLEIIDLSKFCNVDISLYCYNSDGYKVKASVSNLRGGRTPQWFYDNKYAVFNIKHFCEKERPKYKFVDTEYYGVKRLHKFEYIGDKLPLNSDPQFKTTIDLFVNGMVEHPDLTKSKQERNLENILIELSVNYKWQYKIKECRNKKSLPFDFGILNKNHELKGLIEYDSIIHYRPIEFFGGTKAFKQRIKHDHIKNQFALENDIPLLRVNYMDKEAGKLEERVRDFLHENNVLSQLKD